MNYRATVPSFPEDGCAFTILAFPSTRLMKRHITDSLGRLHSHFSTWQCFGGSGWSFPRMMARRTLHGVWGFFFALSAAHAGQCVFRQASAGKRRAMRQAERPNRFPPPFLLYFLDKYLILISYIYLAPFFFFSDLCQHRYRYALHSHAN